MLFFYLPITTFVYKDSNNLLFRKVINPDGILFIMIYHPMTADDK